MRLIRTNCRIALILCMAATAGAQPDRPAQDVGRRVDSALKVFEHQGFSGSILLKSGGGVLLHKGYGFADCAGRRKAGPGTIYDIGSITKVVTAVAVLKLAGQSQVDLGASASKYLPGLAEGKRSIMVEHLLLHRSGLPSHFGDDEDYITRDSFLHLVNACSLKFAPGESQSYSDVGYVLLACVIEELTGTPYEQHIRDSILEPAGARNFGSVLPTWDRPQLACGFWDGRTYGSTVDYFGKDGPTWYLRGAGGLLTNVEGLDSFFDALLGYRLLPQELTDLVIQHLSRQTPAGPLFHTSGSNIVFTSSYSRWTDSNVTMVLLTSDSRFPIETMEPVVVETLNELTGGNP